MINPAPVLYQTLPAMINLAPVLNLTIVAMINSAPVLCYQNSTSNTKVPQICLSSRASWLSAMITLAPIGRVGTGFLAQNIWSLIVFVSRLADPETQSLWSALLVQDCKPLAILSCHGDPWRWWVAWSADCCADAGQGGQCWYLCNCALCTAWYII